MTRIAVFDTKSHDREYLARAAEGRDVHFDFHEFRLNANTAAVAAGTDVVAAFVNDKIDRACLETLAALGVKRLVLRCAGFNNVDRTAAKELGFAITRVPAYSPYAVAEHTVALLLTLNRRIHRAHNRVREQNFSLNGLVGFDLHGKTVGIAGTGKIGKITAKIFNGFGMKILANDPYPDAAWAASLGVEYTTRERMLAESDVISLHLPLSPETRHMINAQSLASMKHGAIILNTGRGALIDSKALIASLKSGHIGGAALDVYEEEEGVFFEDLSGEVLCDDTLARLTTFPNVLITAHQAFFTREALGAIAEVTVDNALRLAAGREPAEGTSVLD